jgi:DNA-binding NarL/FixJ family response regulator
MSVPADTTALNAGVYDENAVGIERAAEQRGRYIKQTTALDTRPAKAVALSEMGFSDSGIAKRLGATEGTVTDYLDAVAERYGIGATFPKKKTEQRGELNATGGERR